MLAPGKVGAKGFISALMILEVLGTMIAYQLLSMLVFSVTYELIGSLGTVLGAGILAGAAAHSLGGVDTGPCHIPHSVAGPLDHSPLRHHAHLGMFGHQ